MTRPHTTAWHDIRVLPTPSKPDPGLADRLEEGLHIPGMDAHLCPHPRLGTRRVLINLAGCAWLVLSNPTTFMVMRPRCKTGRLYLAMLEQVHLCGFMGTQAEQARCHATYLYNKAKRERERY